MFANPFDPPPATGEEGRRHAAQMFQDYTRDRILNQDPGLLFTLRTLDLLKRELSPSGPLLLGWHFPREVSHCDTLAIAADYLSHKGLLHRAG